MLDFLYNPYVMLVLLVIAAVLGAVGGVAYLKSKKKGGNESMKVQSAVLATVLSMLVLLSLPTLSIDIEGIFTYAFDIVNAFMPLIAIVAGLGLGFGLVTKIGSLFQRAL